MRKLSIFFMGVILSFALFFCGNGSIVAFAQERMVFVGGMSAGFTLKTGEVQVIGFCEVITNTGVFSPALEAGLKSGDKIISVNGVSIDGISSLNEIINQSEGKTLKIIIERKGEEMVFSVLPQKDKTINRYKIGILIKDSISGIGTITYIDAASKKFGALGHSVTNNQQTIMQLSDGNVYQCTIVGVNKGIRGKAGELRGMFLMDKQLGSAEKLCDCGIFGQINEGFDFAQLISANANSSDAKPGIAYIYSTVNGISHQKYKIEIVKVDRNNRENKNFVIKIVDKDLISETGGIVQGMSGSPILQDGKLIGAITHVFLNDPTRGFGIKIENMLNK